MLLDSEKTKQIVQNSSRVSERCWCYSAFVTESAMDWMVKIRKDTPFDPGRLLIRGMPNDFLSGASSFTAIRLAIENGWDVRLSSAIHLKVYFFDSNVVAGSANLTGKGMALVENNNDEVCLESPIKFEDLVLAERLWKQGICITENILEKMITWVQEFSDRSDSLLQKTWPEHVLPLERRDLYCSDFPQNKYGINGDNSFNITDIISLKSNKAYSWLENEVKQNGGEAFFGYLTKSLHDSVFDDPAPYRREIKDLLSNLLSYVEVLDQENLHVSRPNYSQVVRMIG